MPRDSSKELSGFARGLWRLRLPIGNAQGAWRFMSVTRTRPLLRPLEHSLRGLLEARACGQLSPLVNAAAVHAARSATGRSPQCASGPASGIAGARRVWKGRHRFRWRRGGKAGISGRGKRRRRSYRRLARIHLHGPECDEGRANDPDSDDTSESQHSVITEQVACPPSCWRYGRPRLGVFIQFDGRGTSNWLKKARAGGALDVHVLQASRLLDRHVYPFRPSCRLCG